ncbi:DUF2975 domain-containing protein [Glycomyces sp. TRM65418]|uniref:DUF2975 domain-containing protein n=1 Tax=Glycomyces sp. TRM65418 TaxID=2867006 RepID=UPI001CE5C4D9|nr:DUF2975 domain-containing protein [Glycomyces sp. TRM65418]MCC3764672.1 DUF2975 domain-containing protein [Glycomyces sp. TRM65418]QZD54332.1 DUF2975 domain-containing protein [Glycomyces sp. TRM65418]
MNEFFIIVLRAALGTGLLIGLFGQIVVVPTTAADLVAVYGDYAPYEVPLVTAAIAGIACIQVVFIAAWALLGMIQRDAIFSDRAFRWVDVTIGSTLTATLIAAAVAVYLFFTEVPTPQGDMEVVSAIGAACLCVGAGASFAMLTAIMRGLLRKATDLQTEMAEVV